MGELVPESVYVEHSDQIYRYLDAKGYRDLVCTAKEGHFAKFYAWYLASIDASSPLYEAMKMSPSSLAMFYNGLFWYRVYLVAQEALDTYSYADNKLFNEMISNPPESPDATVLEETLDLAEMTARAYLSSRIASSSGSI